MLQLLLPFLKSISSLWHLLLLVLSLNLEIPVQPMKAIIVFLKKPGAFPFLLFQAQSPNQSFCQRYLHLPISVTSIESFGVTNLIEQLCIDQQLI